MKTKLLFVSVFFVFIFSCKKETAVVSCTPAIERTYFPLSVGSYWIYEWYRVDTLGNEMVLNSFDTVRIVKDTFIRGFRYGIQEGTYSYTSSSQEIIRKIFRDSLGYLVTPQNKIFFSSTNFTDTLQTINNISYRITYQMEQSISTINTSVGTFECLNFKGQVIPLVGVFNWTERYLNNYYSRGIGKVQENTIYFSSPDVFEKKLIEYHIE